MYSFEKRKFMKNFIRSLFVTLFVAFAGNLARASALEVADAGTSAVNVQCSISGKIYSGTLTFDTNMSNWLKVGSCFRDNYGYEDQLFQLPSFELDFHGSKYVGGNFQYKWGTLNDGCAWDSYAGVGFVADAVNAAEEVQVVFKGPSDTGQLPDHFTMSDANETCTVAITQK